MKFSVGDWVVHPEYGTGQITDKITFDLVEGFERYYKIEILDTSDTNLVVHVPIREIEGSAIRPIMSRNRLDRVLDVLADMPGQLSKDFKTRQARLLKKLKTGRPLRIAEAVRDLTWHKQQTKLSTGDVTLLERGQDLLATEIAAVTKTEPANALQTIRTTLNKALASKSEHYAPQA